MPVLAERDGEQGWLVKLFRQCSSAKGVMGRVVGQEDCAYRGGITEMDGQWWWCWNGEKGCTCVREQNVGTVKSKKISVRRAGTSPSVSLYAAAAAGALNKCRYASGVGNLTTLSVPDQRLSRERSLPSSNSHRLLLSDLPLLFPCGRTNAVSSLFPLCNDSDCPHLVHLPIMAGCLEHCFQRQSGTRAHCMRQPSPGLHYEGQLGESCTTSSACTGLGLHRYSLFASCIWVEGRSMGLANKQQACFWKRCFGSEMIHV